MIYLKNALSNYEDVDAKVIMQLLEIIVGI